MNTLNAIGAWLLARLQEPSTYAGAAAVVASMTFVPHASDVAGDIPAIGIGIGGFIAVILKEKGGK